MLFDLRARGRRRTVKVVYTTLAVLLLLGLVGFGVGGAVNGGLFDAFSGNGSSSGSGTDIFKRDEERLLARIRTTPAASTGKLYAELARIRAQDASSGSNYDSDTGAFTEDGIKRAREAAAAWDKYLATDPAKPDHETASIILPILSALGRDQKAVAAAEIVASAQPNSGTYAQLAQYAWAANQDRKGDLAADKAVALAPKDQRKTLRSQLDETKSTLNGETTDTTTTG